MTTTYDPKLHKIVPIEPTMEMLDAGYESYKEEKERSLWQCLAHSHDAYINASPEVTLNQWQDISTAPKDGTYIILYRPHKDDRKKGSVREGKFFKYGTSPTWLASSGGIWDIGAPTHWMPLPDAPKKGGA